MNYDELAEKLIEAENESERTTLLGNVAGGDILELAYALKNTYYESWTNEPERVSKAAQALKSIVKTNPTEEIKALLSWVSGIALLTKGKLDSAIENLDKSAEIFQTINKEHDSAQTQVSKLYALALLGKYEEAVECGKNALTIFDKYSDELAAGKVEMNLSNIASRREFHHEAERYCLSAQKRFLKAGESSWLTMAENGLANTYAELNDFRRAAKFYALALHHAQETKMFVTEAEIEASIGKLALFRGKYDEALNCLEKSRQKYETLQMPHQTAIATLEIADIYLELNLTNEAFLIYEKVTDKFHKLKLQGEEARARASFGKVAAVLNQTVTARREFKKAARLYVLEKNKVGAASVKLNESKLELDLQNYQKALDLAREAQTLLDRTENFRHLLTARWLQAETRRYLGENGEAQKLFNQIYADSIKQEQPNTAQSAQISLGNLAVDEKDFRRAEKHFKRAIRMIETLRAPLAAEEFRMAFLSNKLKPYQNLAKIYLTENKLEKALTIIEKARARSLAESLEKDISEVQPDKKNEKSAKVLENLREELNWFYSRLNRADDSERKSLQAETRQREKQIADVMRQIASTDEAKTANQHSFDFKNLQKHLGESKALIEFVDFDGVLSAFVITGKKIHYAADLAREDEIAVLLESLQFQFDAMRYGGVNLSRHLGELKKRANFYLQKLFGKLFEPLAKLTADKNLIIVPVGALNYVPFHALFDGKNYLIESREIAHAPSATVWSFLASKPVKKPENALLIGFADERIPFVDSEIETLSGIFVNSKKITGEKATFKSFLRNASQFDVLHLACHGQFRPENPLFSSLHLADGWVTVRDICSQNLKAEIVTLSACETGLNKIFAGDEILGLARGFLSAGAKSLILSLWTVNDETAVDLMKLFYQQLQTGETASKALQIAQCNLIERGFHPYLWSPFVLIGK